MIPLSITLKNFLCYGAEEDGSPYIFNFRDHRLWSICGDNGAGKSAIFDAVTYCLYGQHRGGSWRDDELVRQGAVEMIASLEFGHAGKEFRVTRTIRLGVRPRKGTPTIQRDCRMEWLREDGEWVDVPETSGAKGLESAVRKILGFGCETLTASVVLLQGKSDRLIDAGGKERFDILSGVVELSRYERLAESARDRARQARASHLALASALEDAPPPPMAEVQLAAEAAAKAEQEAEARLTAKSLAEKTVEMATEYWRRTERLALLRSEAEEMEQALKAAPGITAEANEASSLSAALPRLQKALEAQREATKADADAENAEKASAKVDVVTAEKMVADGRATLDDAKRKHWEVRSQIADLRAELAEIAPEVGLAKTLERLEGQIKATSDQVADLETQSAGINNVRSNVEWLRKLAAAKTLITTYKRAREALTAAKERGIYEDPEAELEHRRGRREELESVATRAASAGVEAGGAFARAEARLGEAERILREREEAGDEGTSAHCGQRVSPDHIRKEIAAAHAFVAEAQSVLSIAADKSADAKVRHEAAEAEVEGAKQAESRANERAKAFKRAQAEMEEMEQTEEFHALPYDVAILLRAPLPVLEQGMASLLKAQSELVRLEQRLSQLSKAEASAAAKLELVGGWNREVSDMLATTTRKRLSEARSRDDFIEERLRALVPIDEQLRSAEEQAINSLSVGQDALTKLRDTKRRWDERARLLTQAALSSRQQAEAALTGVGEEFLPLTAELFEAAKERLAQLEGAADRLALLRRAERELDGRRGQITELQSDVAATREEHRVALDEAKKALGSAQEHALDAQQVARESRRAADDVRGTRENRLKMQVDAEAFGRQRAVWDRVTQLLGRSGVQTALMRSALEDIQERANALLSRISGGQLQLSVSCEQTPKGEEIHFRCLDQASAERPLDVQFLSGGQRFRCAVALAAGIGQRAGSGGSMPSQIIDEGFGSLDVQGRAEMLDAIREMSEFYERVIVVSHLESFHDQALFPARFELRKQGTRTVVTTVA